MVLQAEFDLASVGGDLGNVSAIEIGGLLVPETGETSAMQVETRRSLADLKPAFSKAKKILEDLWGETKTSEIIESIPPDAALDVNVKIGIRSTRRKIDRHCMGDLATGLRNLGDGDVRIRANDRTVKGADARLHETMPFKRIRQNGSLLDLEHTRSQLKEVHMRFVADGKIDTS